MLFGFRPIFVVDTKIIYGYNFAAPLKDATFNYVKTHTIKYKN